MHYECVVKLLHSLRSLKTFHLMSQEFLEAFYEKLLQSLKDLLPCNNIHNGMLPYAIYIAANLHD